MKTLQELEEIRNKTRERLNVRQESSGDIRIVIGMATCGIAAGARPVLQAFSDEVGKRNLGNVKISQTGCIGICQYEPVVEVMIPGQEKVTYVKMSAEKAIKVVTDHIVNGNVVSEYTIGANAK